jgi:tetratricopeptide (TPR) repeat protein
MKKILSLGLFSMICCISYAQSGKVISAYEYLKVGALANAKMAIDTAVVHPKTADNAKTWFYYGNTYNAIARSEQKSQRELDIDAVDKAISGYLKALSLDTKGKYTKEINTELAILKTLLVNQAIEAFNKKGFEFALTKFTKAVEIAEKVGVQDTIAYFYGAVSASQAGKTDEALVLYKKCVDVKCCGADVFVAMASIYRNRKDDDNLKNIIEQGRTRYPANAALVLELLNLQLSNKNYEEAIVSIELALSQTPDDKNLHFAMGMAQDYVGNAEEAISAYRNAIAIDSRYFEANFNLGALFNNIGDEFAEKANKLDYKTEGDKIDNLHAQATVEYKKALPLLKKSYEIKSNDPQVKLSLRILYAKLGMLKESAALEN